MVLLNKKGLGDFVSSFSVSLSSVSEIKSFVETVSKFTCDVHLSSGDYSVSAVSIMGVFSLDLTKPITVDIKSGKDEAELIEALSQYKV